MARHQTHPKKQAQPRAHTQPREAYRQARHLNGAAEERLTGETIAAIEGIEVLQKETADFIGRRMGHAVDTLERCRECRNVAQMFALQQAWLLNAAQDYIEVGFKLAHAATGAAWENSARMQRLAQAEAFEMMPRA